MMSRRGATVVAQLPVPERLKKKTPKRAPKKVVVRPKIAKPTKPTGR
jgi:hypothetical protein